MNEITDHYDKQKLDDDDKEDPDEKIFDFDFDNFTEGHHMKNLEDFDLYAKDHG